MNKYISIATFQEGPTIPSSPPGLELLKLVSYSFGILSRTILFGCLIYFVFLKIRKKKINTRVILTIVVVGISMLIISILIRNGL